MNYLTDYDYFLGGEILVPPYNQAEEEYQNMLRLVAYDIKNSRRLYRVAKICKEYGFRVEYSVFECDLNEMQFNLFWERLLDVTDEKEDRLLCYELCRNCVKQILSYGPVIRPKKPLLYIL